MVPGPINSHFIIPHKELSVPSLKVWVDNYDGWLNVHVELVLPFDCGNEITNHIVGLRYIMNIEFKSYRMKPSEFSLWMGHTAAHSIPTIVIGDIPGRVDWNAWTIAGCSYVGCVDWNAWTIAGCFYVNIWDNTLSDPWDILRTFEIMLQTIPTTIWCNLLVGSVYSICTSYPLNCFNIEIVTWRSLQFIELFEHFYRDFVTEPV